MAVEEGKATERHVCVHSMKLTFNLYFELIVDRSVDLSTVHLIRNSIEAVLLDSPPGKLYTCCNLRNKLCDINYRFIIILSMKLKNWPKRRVFYASSSLLFRSNSYGNSHFISYFSLFFYVLLCVRLLLLLLRLSSSRG